MKILQDDPFRSMPELASEMEQEEVDEEKPLVRICSSCGPGRILMDQAPRFAGNKQ